MAFPKLQSSSHFPQDETRRIDRLIGSLLHSLDVLGTATLRVAAELEASPLTIEELKQKSGILTADEVLTGFARRSPDAPMKCK